MLLAANQVSFTLQWHNCLCRIICNLCIGVCMGFCFGFPPIKIKNVRSLHKSEFPSIISNLHANAKQFAKPINTIVCNEHCLIKSMVIFGIHSGLGGYCLSIVIITVHVWKCIDHVKRQDDTFSMQQTFTQFSDQFHFL